MSWQSPEPEWADDWADDWAEEWAEDRAARRVAWFFACSVGALIVGLVTMFAVGQVQDRRDALVGRTGVTAEPGVEAEPIVDTEIGPRPGEDIEAYIQARHLALEDLEGEVLAVVSLATYVDESTARKLANDAQLDVGGVLAAVPGGPPELVAESMTVWVRQQRSGLEENRGELSQLLPSVESAAFRDEYESEIARLEELLAVIDFDSDLVFGLVVRGDAEGLRTIEADVAVRLVDASDLGVTPTRYGGVRPEEQERSGAPPIRPPQ